MNIPLTQSHYIQLSRALAPKIEIKSNGSPRDSQSARNIEQTLHARLFSEKKRALFQYNTNGAREIGFSYPQAEYQQQPSQSPPKQETVKIHDCTARSIRAN